MTSNENKTLQLVYVDYGIIEFEKIKYSMQQTSAQELKSVQFSNRINYLVIRNFFM